MAAASHAPGLAGLYDGAPEATKAEVDKMYGAMAEEIAAANLDVLMLLASSPRLNTVNRTASPSIWVEIQAPKICKYD